MYARDEHPDRDVLTTREAQRGALSMSGAGHVRVVYPHIEGASHPQVVQRLRDEGYVVEDVVTAKADPYSYSSLIRELWRAGVGFFLVEQHALPPAGGVAEQMECEHVVCSRPHDCRRRGVMGSLACVKFSDAIVQALPDFADRVLARQRPDEWWRAGLLNTTPWFPGAARPRGLRNATVNTAAVRELGPWPNANYPTTQEWPHSDTVIFNELDKLGITTHYHAEPSVCFPDPNEQLTQ